MSDQFRASKQWEYINNEFLSNSNLSDISSFRSNSINFKIALWNPTTNGIRYLKTLTYNLASNFSEPELDILRKIKILDFGEPIQITNQGIKVCLDYVQATLEITFLKKAGFNFLNSSILEIGAGYGRTCHSILENYDIKKYTIIDLKNGLELSRKYLSQVLSKEQFSKILFLDIDSLNQLENNYDLTINIDSFAEMYPDVVVSYIKLIDQKSNYFYSKNPMCKYLDKKLDQHSEGANVVNLALETGILREVLDIFDNQVMEKQSAVFEKAYCPSSNWKKIHSSWGKPWSHYWQTLYKKEK